ncbi:MAG: leucyl aminopeptidase [Gemmatimonadetes bacterium]|nr:leucyl aminopeptidase [Gemmatimonadota bacterium]
MAEPTITAARIAADQLATPLLVLPGFEGEGEPTGFVAAIDARCGGALGRVVQSGDFGGRPEEALVLYPADPREGIQRVLLVGAGKRAEYNVTRLRRAVGTAVRVAERMGIAELDISLGPLPRASEAEDAFEAGVAATEAALLAAWDFRELKSTAADAPRATLTRVGLLAPEDREAGEFQRAVAHGSITARAANLARELQTRPGNQVTPAYLGERAAEMGRELGLEVTVLDRAAIEREGMKALLAVASGSAQEPRFIVIEYHGGTVGAAPVVLVGKGVTFDSGGISIKPAERMEDMKYDMSGAAAVLGALRGIAELRLPINVVGVVPAAENLPSGTAYKPGDVIGSHLGKHIEIVNTDAEGRLILADALSYVRRYHPAAVVNAATLTGACVIALGHHAIGLMGNDTGLMEEVQSAGARVGERCWPMPLWDEYRPQLDSNVADLKNAGGRPAGAITAGWFLKEFVDYPWVHLDIAGTAYTDEAAPYLRKGATGVPTRLFIEWVRARAEA